MHNKEVMGERVYLGAILATDRRKASRVLWGPNLKVCKSIVETVDLQPSRI